MEALLLIDLQNDFCKGGALEVPEGNEVVSIANALIPQFKHVIATQDWHPANHGSFAAMHPWRKPGQVIDLNGLSQVLWPTHCVQNTFGAEFVKDLNVGAITHIVYKGTDPAVDSYSGFFDNGHLISTGLTEYLQSQFIDTVYIMGLATDYCVKFTALDAISEGFNTFVVADGCRGVNLQEGDVQRALGELAEKGVTLIQSDALLG